MKIYNYSTATIMVEGVEVDQFVIDLPDAFQGEVTIGGSTLDWDEDENFQYVLVSDTGGGYALEHPLVAEPPIWSMVWLSVMVGGFAFMVKIVQKIKSG